MDFLSCTPSVFVIENEYEILINVKEKGIIAIEINGVKYYEDNAGTLSSEKVYSKVRIPQDLLNASRKYTVTYRSAPERKAYYTKLGEEQRADFSFKPLEKTENINIYHIADVHYRFDLGISAADYFGDDTDLFIFNGDIGEVENFNHYFEVAKFTGEVSKGMIPVIFVRGNHDARGKMAEFFPEYFPAAGKKTYYKADIGALKTLVLDCGEDKPDGQIEYGGVNDFYSFRRRELSFLKSIDTNSNTDLVITHICPMQTTTEAGGQFDIERDLYTEWHKELNRIDVDFMLCGHMHKAYVLKKNDPRSLISNSFPVIVGSACFGDKDLWGTAITLTFDKIFVKFTDKDKNIKESFVIDRKTKEIL